MNMRLFSAIDETDSSNGAEHFLKSTHLELYSFNQFIVMYAEINRAYRIEAEFQKDFHTLRKRLIDFFSAVIFSEKYFEELTNKGEPNVDNVTMEKEIENFFERLGYNIKGMAKVYWHHPPCHFHRLHCLTSRSTNEVSTIPVKWVMKVQALDGHMRIVKASEIVRTREIARIFGHNDV
ncbi:hypothetical protein QYF36_020530 [Acer negundo]|nr:hypothetical protein QYF36_020530 [Acer negundo]